MDIIPIIMCGGAGTRLWPLSREATPKHLLPLNGGPSTFQRTLLRFKDVDGFGRPVVITSADARFAVAGQMHDIGVAGDLILEPSRRDSAAAVAVAALHAAARGEDAVAMVLAADHFIDDAAAFRDAARTAGAGAVQGLIMTLGVKPTHPATGYGYIAPGEPLASPGCFRLKSFREKPDAEAAARYIADGYLWNSGNFLFRPSVMIEELDAHAADILACARGAYAAAERDRDFIRLDAAAFGTARRTSIDFAVMEKTKRAGVALYGGDWSDIGTFDALWEAMPKDAEGNALSGETALVDVRNSLVQGDGVLAAVLGVDNVVVIATPDAVLVTTRSRSGEVKTLVEKLKGEGRLPA